MCRLRFIFFFLLAVILSCCSRDDTQRIVFLQSTDIHGDPYLNLDRQMGFIKEQRKQFGDNLIVMDGGDCLQGTPQVYYSNFIDTANTHFFAHYFNEAGYDLLCVGNHDVEAGKSVFDKVYKECNATTLCANLIDAATKKPYYAPYKILVKGKYKIAVLGLTTQYILMWVPEHRMEGLTVEFAEKVVGHWVEYIKEHEKPDVMVGLFHSGQLNEPETHLGSDNMVMYALRQYPEFDVIFSGHSHFETCGNFLNNSGDSTLLVNCGCKAQKMGRVELLINKDGKKVVDAQLIPTDSMPSDETFRAEMEDYMKRVNAFSNAPEVELKNTIYSKDHLKGPSPWVDEEHRAQMDVVERDFGFRPDMSFASALKINGKMEQGRLSLRNFYNWYPYENSLYLMSMTGAEIRRYLEFGMTKLGEYDFDSIFGLHYVLHPKAPEGQKVEILNLDNGRPFNDSTVYKVVMNSYRRMGGGDYITKGLGWSTNDISERTIWRSERDFRILFYEWAKEKSPFEARAAHYWYID